MTQSIPQSIMPSARYTKIAIILHWTVAGLIALNVVLGLSAESLPDSVKRFAIDTHKSVGITVLGLALLRILWRLANPPPAYPAAYGPLERKTAHWVHWSLYGLMFLIPLSGWVHDSAWKGAPTHPFNLFGLIPWFRFGFIMNLDPAFKEKLHDASFLVHASLGYVLYALVALHIVGALKHQFFDKERELQRMMLHG
jgi:cytochrome b561